MLAHCARLLIWISWSVRPLTKPVMSDYPLGCNVAAFADPRWDLWHRSACAHREANYQPDLTPCCTQNRRRWQSRHWPGHETAAGTCFALHRTTFLR